MGENAGHNYVPYASWGHSIWQVLASVRCNKCCAIVLTFVDGVGKLFKAAKSDVLVIAERKREVADNDKNGSHPIIQNRFSYVIYGRLALNKSLMIAST